MRAETQGDQGNAACAALTGFAQRTASRLDAAVGKLSQKRTQATDRKTERVRARQEHADRIQARWQERRRNLYSRLDTLVTAAGDGAEGNVSAFKQAVDQAVAEHRSAIDSANEIYAVGLQDLLDAQKRAVDDAKAVYADVVTAALDAAKAACADGGDAATVRADLKAALDAARGTLQDARRGVGTYKDAHQELIANRKAAFGVARETFLSAMRAAVDRFKETLSEADSGEETDSGTGTQD